MASSTESKSASAAQDLIIQKIPRIKTNTDARNTIIAIFLLALLNLHSDFSENGNWSIGQLIRPMVCMAGPVPTSLVLPPTSQSADSASMIRVVNLTRQYGGDIFTAFGKLNGFKEPQIRAKKMILYLL